MGIEQYLQQILSARYGKDVRQSIHDSIYEINETAKKAEYDASTAPESAKAYAQAALASEQAAEDYKTAAEQAAQQAMSGTPEGYADLVAKVNSIYRQTATSYNVVGTSEGSALAHTIYGMSVQDGTPTPSVPVEIKSAKADFRCTGKNLISYPYYDTSKTVNGITFTDNGDGSITVNGTATGISRFAITAGNLDNVKDGERVTLSGCPSGGGNNIYTLYTQTANNYDYGNGQEFNWSDNITGIAIAIFSGITVNNLVFKPMLTLADADQTYEVNKHKDITTNLTLRSIEVASTDDYTYERDGKYYIADTIDWSEDEGYQITRRIGEVVLDGSIPIASISGNTVQIMHTAFSQMRANLNVGYSNRFAHKSSNYTTGGDANTGLSSGEFSYRKGQVTTTANQRSIYIKNSDFTTISNASTWFASNNTNIAFVLETPITESITSEQAQALLSLKTYDEATSISATGDIEPSVDLEYAKSEMGAKALTGHNEAYIAQELESVYGVKNLIPYPYYETSKTVNGITFTVNEDGSVTVNGTATATAQFGLISRTSSNFYIKNGTYTLSGCPKQNGLQIRIVRTVNGADSQYGQDTGNGLIVNRTDEENPIGITIQVNNGTTVDNLTFKPMFRLASIQSDEYQPYAMSNYELTKKIKELETALIELSSQ